MRYNRQIPVWIEDMARLGDVRTEIKERDVELEPHCSVETVMHCLEKSYLFKWTDFLTYQGQLGEQVGLWVGTTSVGVELGKLYLAVLLRKPQMDDLKQ